MAKKAARKKAPPRRGAAPGRTGAAGVRGQPRFVKTEAQSAVVMGLVSIGTEIWAIAQALQLPERTLYRHFQDELQRGKHIIHARIGGGIVAAALAGDKTMMIFYAKAQMGWRDRHTLGFDDAAGNPVNPSNLFTIAITG